ncbi:MAG: hypothetical protein QXW01_01245 [Candidatus Aenigmatarchaeota archaeon]
MKAISFGIVLFAVAFIGAFIGTSLILMNQKVVITINLNLLYNSNEAYRSLVSLLSLNRAYRFFSLFDYYTFGESEKIFISELLNRSLLNPKCFSIVKDGRIIISSDEKCDKTSYNSVLPIFTPGMKVEGLYLGYSR